VNGAYHQLEILSGEFISLVELPVPVQYDKVSADYADGFLTITLPKTEIVRVEVMNKNDANVKD
jgi:HSP20 family protein